MLEDIESLNRRARTGELEVTAVSAATYVLVHEQYRMMDPGASMGKGYGPHPRRKGAHGSASPSWTRWWRSRAATPPPPCSSASSWAIRRSSRWPSTRSRRWCSRDEADLGLLIHEGRSRIAQMGLHKVLDLGEVWEKESGLPLPLGDQRDAAGPRRGRASPALAGSARLHRLRLRSRGRGARVRDALRPRDRQGDLPRASCSCTSTTTRSASGPDGEAALRRLYQLALGQEPHSALPPVDPI